MFNVKIWFFFAKIRNHNFVLNHTSLAPYIIQSRAGWEVFPTTFLSELEKFSEVELVLEIINPKLIQYLSFYQIAELGKEGFALYIFCGLISPFVAIRVVNNINVIKLELYSRPCNYCYTRFGTINDSSPLFNDFNFENRTEWLSKTTVESD